MNDDLGTPEAALARAFSGKGIHVGPVSALEGLDWENAGRQPDGFPHSVFQLVNHMTYWQAWLVKWMNGDNPPTPAHADGGWPGPVSPASKDEWEAAVAGFVEALERLKRRALDGDLLVQVDGKSRLEMLHMIAAHNSYHLGQVVAVRHLLGAWPPPSGGLTW